MMPQTSNVPRRRRRPGSRGRPPLSWNDPSVAIHLKVPSRVRDDLIAQAARGAVTVPEHVRRAIAIATKLTRAGLTLEEVKP